MAGIITSEGTGFVGHPEAGSAMVEGMATSVKVAGEGEWDDYYAVTAGRPPSRWFIAAMDAIDGNRGRGRRAIDLGCGPGVESHALIERGWSVIAVDREQSAIDRVIERMLRLGLSDRLETLVGSFHEVALPPADLVLAQLSLPFCSVDTFDSALANTLGAVKPGGALVAQFFGPDDDWAESGCLSHTVEQVEGFIDGFDIVDLEEERGEGVAGARRQPKFWHIISIIAIRPG